MGVFEPALSQNRPRGSLPELLGVEGEDGAV